MKRNKEIKKTRFAAFTLIELLVSISILATISIVGYVSYAGHMKNSYNATRIESIDSLHLSLSDYSQLKKTLPDPTSNYVAYDERGTYRHSLSGSYGVSGYVSRDFLPAGYVNFSATDPENGQFYGYGKLTDNTSFDLAAALYDEVTGGYKTYLRGTYPRQRLSSLIRAYSSSSFVSQDSTEELPYNPYERKITARISASSGTVTLTNSKWVTLSLTGELNAGDTVTVAAGSRALLHISDGSELSLGNAVNQTVLALSTLEYQDDNNLVSRVALYLKSGEVWTEAPHLRNQDSSTSDFSIRTNTAVAAVRGTVFGIQSSSTGVTDISLVFGKLEVTRITANAAGDILSQQSFVASNGFSTTATGWFIIDGSGSYMVVPDGGQAITLNGITNTATDGTVPPTSTGTLSPTDIQNKIQHPPFSLGYRPIADRISFSGIPDTAGTNHIQTGILSVTFQNPGADSYELYFGTGITDPTQTLPIPPDIPSYTGTLNTATGTVTLTGSFPYNPDPHASRVYSLKICYQWQCSAPDIKNLWGDIFSFDHFRIWGEQGTGSTVTPTTPMTVAVIPPATCTSDDPTQPDFWTGACVATHTGLVAYAPYDGTTTNIYYTGARSLIGIWNSLEDTTYRPYDTTGNKFTDSVSGLSTVPPYYTSIGLSKLTQPGSMYQWGTTKGILLDNNNSTDGTTTLNDSLKYDLTPLALGNNFSIEMSVRGSALKRWFGTIYKLFDLSGINLEINNVTWNMNFYLTWSNPNYTRSTILYSNLFSKITDDNKFYRVVAKVENWNPSLSVFEGNTSILSWVTTNSWWIVMSFWTSLYMGSSKNSDKQWNDIIDSVKIYKY